jgi:GR25 family glycosyltransferase involved in LPS biosynthesis
MDHSIERKLNVITELKQSEIIKSNPKPHFVKRVSGVNGSLVTIDTRRAYTSPCIGRFLSNGTIGCAMSHRTTWKKIIDSSLDFALVLEDDCYFSQDFSIEFQKVLDTLYTFDWDFIYLGTFGGVAENKENYTFFQNMTRMFAGKLFKGYNKTPTDLEIPDIFMVPELPLGFHGYLIKKEYAKQLYSLTFPISGHIDLQAIQSSTPESVVISLKNKIIHQKTSVNTSTITTNDFPAFFNSILKEFYDDQNLSPSYYLSVPFLEIIQGIPINLYSIIFIWLACFMPIYFFKYIILFLLIELLLRLENYRVVLFTLSYYTFIIYLRMVIS